MLWTLVLKVQGLLAAVTRSFHSGKLTLALQYKHSNADANFPEFFQFVSVWQLPDTWSVILSANHSCTTWFDVFSVSQDFLAESIPSIIFIISCCLQNTDGGEQAKVMLF
uniref:Secreted protein n=1 Tax=Micrurus spixii TaxID=129469 RepID=A0A2D4LXE0_9SAUR